MTLDHSPDFASMTKIGSVPTVREAFERYYKPDRLRDPATLVARCEAALAEDGHDLLASRHESNNGLAIWIVQERDGGFSLFSRMGAWS